MRAVLAARPLARAHGLDHLLITCNPDNLPSGRTCELLGADFLSEVDVPPDQELRRQGTCASGCTP